MGNTTQQNDRNQSQPGQQNQGQRPAGGQQGGSTQNQPARKPGSSDSDRMNRKDESK